LEDASACSTEEQEEEVIAFLPLIAVLNFSTVPNTTVQHWVNAIQRQVSEDFCPKWHMNANLRFYSASERPPEGAWLIRIVPGSNRSEHSGYHLSVDDHGIPYADVFVIRGERTDLTLSHEVLEMLANPYDDRYVEDFPFMWMLEVADPVQHESYERDGVKLSNFVFPGWFDALTRTLPLDFLGTVDTPGHVSHGSAIRLDERTGRREMLH
jgi:hypothetical protein